MVPGTGIEPARAEARRILSPLRLPVPPSRHSEAFLLYGSVDQFEHYNPAKNLMPAMCSQPA